MIIIAINGKDYDLRNQWKDMTIGQAIELSKVVKVMPEFLRDYYIKGKEITVEQIENELPDYYRKIIATLTEIDSDTINGCLWSDVTAVYKLHCEKLIFDLLGQPSEVEQIKSFKYNGEEFFIPELTNVQTVQFTEAADLIKHSENVDGGLVEVLPTIIAVLCQKKDEPYIEQVALVRAKHFRELPMPIAWSVFFSFLNCTNNYLHVIQTYLKEGEFEQLKPLTTAELMPSDGMGQL